MKKVTKSTSSKKIKATTDNDLGKFLTGNDEVKPRGKSQVKVEVKTEVKPKLEPQVISEVNFSKEKLTELGFEIEVLPSGQKTNLMHKQKYTLNGFNPMFFRGFYTHTVHYAPDKVSNYIKSIEFL